MPQVLEIPASGVAAPQVVPSRRELLTQGVVDAIRQSPVGLVLGPAARGRFVVSGSQTCPQGCECVCKPGEGQPQSPPGLGQPQRPQKPFQSGPQSECSLVDEALARVGLSTALLCQCLKCAPKRSRTARRSSGGRKRRKAARKPAARTAKRKAKRSAKRRASKKGHAVRGSGGRFRWVPGKGARGVCIDTKTRKFVSRAKCGK